MSVVNHPSALIVDDDELVGQTIKRMLARSDIAARWTPSPADFLDYLAKSPPTIAFVDLSMPDMDGVSLMAKISEVAPDVPIALISGRGKRLLNAAGRSAEEHGLLVKAILEKPFRAKDVVDAVINCADNDSVQEELAKRRRSRNMGPEWLLSPEQVAQAIKNQDIVPYYQPKIDCKTEKLIGLEVLARWKTQSGRIIPPFEFVPLVEDAGLITDMTLSLAHQTFAWMDRLEIEGLTVALNMSALSLDDESFLDAISEIADEAGVARERITLELTETSAHNMSTSTLDLLTRFSLHGFKLSMDDFGTGYSSVAALTRMPFDELKIDRQFVDNMLTDESSRAVVELVKDLGHRLEMQVVAEGVETREIFQALRDVQCDVAQGYLFGRPVSGSEFIEQWSGKSSENSK